MTVNLSALAGAGQQFFDNSGNPLTGGKLYSYAAGTTTPQATYTSAAGSTPHANPIILDSAGRVATGEIWVTAGSNYKFVLKTSTDTTLATWDNITGINGTGIATNALYVAYDPAGTGAVSTNVQAKLREIVSVFDFMTAAQVTDVQSGTVALDVTTAIQNAINYAATRASVGGIVYMPPGSYKTTSTIYTYGSGGVGQVALVGAGIFSTQFKPSGNFTVLNVVTSYEETGGFSIEWPITAAASIPSSRIGIEIAGANWQFSYATLKNVTVSYAYRGFVLNDWTGQPYGSVFLCTLQQLTAFRCADWGFYINSKTGSTTLRMIHCYVRGENSSGGAAYGKGVYVTNVNDIYTEQVSIDQCLNNWIQFVNYNVAVLNSTALESNKMLSSSATAVYFNGSQTVINGFKDLSCTYDTSGNARVIFCGANVTLSLSGYNEQYSTVAGGTTKYRVAFNAATTDITILDRTVVPSQVLDNGFFVNTVYQGQRKTSNSIAPNYGTWLRGDLATNGLPTVGQPKGWSCTVAGSPGTWVSTGNL